MWVVWAWALTSEVNDCLDCTKYRVLGLNVALGPREEGKQQCWCALVSV